MYVLNESLWLNTWRNDDILSSQCWGTSWMIPFWDYWPVMIINMKQKRKYLQPYLRNVITVMASGRNAYSKSSQSAKSGAQPGFKQKSKHMANTDEWQVACRLRSSERWRRYAYSPAVKFFSGESFDFSEICYFLAGKFIWYSGKRWSAMVLIEIHHIFDVTLDKGPRFTPSTKRNCQFSTQSVSEKK